MTKIEKVSHYISVFVVLYVYYRIFLENIPKSVHRRQDCVPIVYVAGSHYEVRYMVVSILDYVYYLKNWFFYTVCFYRKMFLTSIF